VLKGNRTITKDLAKMLVSHSHKTFPEEPDRSSSQLFNEESF